jgi:hypothetical protein
MLRNELESACEIESSIKTNRVFLCTSFVNLVLYKKKILTVNQICEESAFNLKCLYKDGKNNKSSFVYIIPVKVLFI